MGVAREPPGTGRRPVEVGLGDDLDDPAHQVVAQRRDPLGVLRLALDGLLDGRCQPGDRRHVQRAAADVALLPAAVHQRRHREVASYDEGADAVGAPELVPGEAQRVDAGRGEVDGDGADRLHRVGVHRDGVLGGDLHDLLDRLHGADLVVGPHHRDQRDRRGITLHRLAQRVEAQHAPVVDREQLDLGTVLVPQPHERVEDGVVLDRRGEDAGPARVLGPARPEDPLGRQVVRLGPARGEDHVARSAAQDPRDGLA